MVKFYKTNDGKIIEIEITEEKPEDETENQSRNGSRS